ncbi:MAG: transposase [Planctomycetaceae bacterium]
MRTRWSDNTALPAKYRRLLPLTGLNNSQYEVLLINLKQADRPGMGRPWRLPLSVRLLLILIHLRTNLTTRALAAVFTTSQSTVDRIVHNLTPTLAKLLKPEPTEHEETWIIDGTLIPVHDQRLTALSKNYRRSINTQIIIHAATRKVVTASQTWPGNRNDVIVARATVTELLKPSSRCILGDGGYRGIDRITGPVRDRTGRIIKDDHWKAHRKVRARVEHVIARLKDWQILRQCRRRGNAINQALQIVSGLHNLKLGHLRVNS